MSKRATTFSLLAALLACLATPGALAATLEDFARHPELLDVKISPDGRHLAMLRREAQDSLYVVRLADMSVATGLNSTPGQRFHDFYWANDNRLLLEPALEVTGHAHPLPTGEILGFSLDGKANGYLKRSNSAGGLAMYKLINALPDDPEHVLVAEHFFATDSKSAPVIDVAARQHEDLALADAVLAFAAGGDAFVQMRDRCAGGCPRDDARNPKLLKLNVYTGATTAVATAPMADADFVADPLGGRVLVTGHGSGGTIEVHALQAGEWAHVTGFSKGMGTVPISVTRDGRVFALDNRVDTIGLATLEPRDGSVTAVFRDPVSDLDRAITGADGELLAMRYTPGFPSWFYLQPDSAFTRTHKSLRAAFPDSDVDVTSFTRNNAQAVLRVYSDRNPGSYYFVDTASGETRFLINAQAWIKPEDMLAKQPVEVETSDGFTVHGYLTLPKNVPAGRQPPLVVVVHDRPFTTRHRWEFDEEPQLLAGAGYAVLQVDPRGAAGYGRGYASGSDEELDRAMLRDLADAAQWAATRELVDGDRVCVYGEGLSGYLALMALIRYPEQFNCAVGYGGVYAIDGEHDARPLDVSLVRDALLERSMANKPWQDSPVDMTDRVEGSVFLAHGKLDQVVPFRQAERMAEALQREGKPFEAMFADDEGHRFMRVDNRVQLYRSMLAFFSDHIDRGAAPPILEPPLQGQVLDAEQLEKLQALFDKMHADLKRIARPRDERDTPTGLDRGNDPARLVARALNGRDREAREIVGDVHWAKYEQHKALYQQQLERALARGQEPPPYKLPAL